MNGFCRLAGSFLLASITPTIGVQCLAQATKVNADDLMDIVFDMKKAAATADRIASDGRKYCHWGVAPLDASDLDSAVSRFLLSHVSRVPDDIPASKMWRVSSVAGDLIDQLEMGLQDCNLGMLLNRDIYNVAVAGEPVLSKLIDAKTRFTVQAYQQTAWQERHRSPDGADEGLGTPETDANDILGASLEIKEAWKSASMVLIEAETTKECAQSDSPKKPDEPVELNKLIDRLSGVSRSGSYIPAADMWLVAFEAENKKLEATIALKSCTYYALWKKKAKKVANEASDSYQRLKAAIAKFDGLALKQTEWEEQAIQHQAIIQEH